MQKFSCIFTGNFLSHIFIFQNFVQDVNIWFSFEVIVSRYWVIIFWVEGGENRCMIDELVKLVLTFFDCCHSKSHFGFFFPWERSIEISAIEKQTTTICALIFCHAIPFAMHLHCIEYVDLIKRVLPLNDTKHLTDSKCFTDRCFGIETHTWSICWIFSWI